MEIKILRSWNEFEDELEDITEFPTYEGGNSLDPTDFLFRGQSNADWSLSTTLERVMNSNKIDMLAYYNMMRDTKSRIETFTGNTWILPDSKEYTDLLAQSELWMTNPPTLEYMAYLRHHGFPSPLLDWSLSPFVAAYFAFRDLSSKVDSVSIYAFAESPGGVKQFYQSIPNIVRLNENIKADQRHFLQQSVYTICTAKVKDKHYYCNHEEVLARDDKRQDLLLKFVLPATERRNALRKLDTYNINAYSIMQSEDSLIEAVFLREYIQKWFYFE